MTEILAPAGDLTSAYAAVNSGADAIYLGLTAFSARSSAQNFDMSELSSLLAHAHVLGVKIYVAMNTLVKESELQSFTETAVAVWNAGADAIIIQDLYVGAYLKKTYPQICLHLSTQAGICNAEGAKYAKQLGFSRVILARETSLKDIEEIASVIETEVFVQGALCTAFSGQCYLSSFAGGNSGNRGKCKQPCRKRYKIDREGFSEYAYRISLSDLCVGEKIKKLAEAGVSSFKIEGRMRRPEYVAAAVTYYRNILDDNQKSGDLSALKRTYNRGNYTKGLAFGQEKSFISSAVQGHIGEFIGTVFVENGRFVCHSAERCEKGDSFKILREGSEIGGATFDAPVKGGFAIKSGVRLKNGDKVFITTDASLTQELLAPRKKRGITLSVYAAAGEKFSVSIDGKEYAADFCAQVANGRPIGAEDIKTCFNKVDSYPFEIEYANLQIEEGVFLPMSLLNAFRREVYADLFATFSANNNKRIEKIIPLPERPNSSVKNGKTCVLATDLKGVEADIGVLRPNDYFDDLSPLMQGFKGEKFLYLPPFLSGEEMTALKPVIEQFDGIYGGGNYIIPLAEALNKKAFAGCGFNLTNSLSISLCPADYVALSKELTHAESRPLAGENTFMLTAGDIKVMDLIYCPFSKTCKSCDKRNIYTLTDEENRRFTLRRYKIADCRFEVINCAALVTENNFTGRIFDFTTCGSAADMVKNAEKLKMVFTSRTKGHSENPVL